MSISSAPRAEKVNKLAALDWGNLRAELTKVELNWGKMIWNLWNCYSR